MSPGSRGVSEPAPSPSHVEPCRQPHEIVLLRHPPVGVPPGVCYGRLDVALGEGWEQKMFPLAAAVAASGPGRVLCSPSTRCLLPARALAGLLGLPVLVEPDLMELDFGAWEGIAWDAVSREALDRWAADPLHFAPPGGESGASLLRRTHRIACRLRDAACNVLVVAHGGPLRVLPALLRGEPPDLMSPTQAMGAIEIVRIT